MVASAESGAGDVVGDGAGDGDVVGDGAGDGDVVGDVVVMAMVLVLCYGASAVLWCW